MRTVTFADPETTDRMNRDFVLVWSNQQPELISGKASEPSQAQTPFSQEEAKQYPLGGGGGNIRSYFCDSEGHVLYYLEGYWDPARYRHECEFALTLADGKDLEGRLVARQKDVDRERQELYDHCEAARARPGTTEESKLYAALGLLSTTFGSTSEVLRQPVEPILTAIQEEGKRGGVIS